MIHELPPHTHPQVLALLLDAYADQLPAPMPPKWEREHDAGLAATTWHDCPSCDAGQQRWKHRAVTCPRCHGQGGWKVDPYDERHQPITITTRSDLSLPQIARTLCGMELKELERIVPLTDDLAMVVRAQHPAFTSLERALLTMREVAPHHRGALVCIHILHIPARTALYDDALLVLGITLGPAFHAPGWVRVKADEQLRGERARKANSAGRHALNDTQRQRRDHEVRRLADRGDKPAAIGRRLGLDRRTVERILTHQEAA